MRRREFIAVLGGTPPMAVRRASVYHPQIAGRLRTLCGCTYEAARFAAASVVGRKL
jgi:hypothetical protein